MILLSLAGNMNMKGECKRPSDTNVSGQHLRKECIYVKIMQSISHIEDIINVSYSQVKCSRVYHLTMG